MNTYKKLNRRGIHTALAALSVMVTQPVWAEALNTQLPKQQEESFGVPVNVDIPAQPLANSLHDLGKTTGMNISFPNDIVSGKTAPQVRGRMTSKEALQRVLGESGLVSKVEGNNIFIQKPLKEEKKDMQLDKVEVRAKRFYEVGPLPGLGLTKEEIPGNVQSISAKEIKEAHSLSLADLMNRKLQSVTVNDYQGNPFQMDVQYRGFTAGPQIGTPQGLSVFFDGIRVNEPFGDVVNWDMIPMNALAGVDVFPGSNPIFGLNTLGGAFALKTKDGFNNAGVDADVLTGSFGRKQLQLEGGWNNGTVGLFAAGNFFMEDGWRQNSPSKVNQLFTKASFRGEKLDLNLSALLVANDLTGNGLLPSQMYDRDRSSVYTSPDSTKNRLNQFQLSSSYFVNDTFTITGQIYRRNSKRHQKGSDVMMDYEPDIVNQRIRGTGEQATCLFAESQATSGVPAYYVIPVPADASGYADITSTSFYQEISNNYSADPAFPDGRFYINPAAPIDPANPSGPKFQDLMNTGLPSDYAQKIRDMIAFNKNPYDSIIYNRDLANPNPGTGPALTDSFGNPILDGSGNPIPSYNAGGTTFPSRSGASLLGSNIFDQSLLNDDLYFYTPDPANPGGYIKNFVVLAAATNNDACYADFLATDAYRSAGLEKTIDGAGDGGTGVVKGVPTAVVINNQIDQVTDGFSLQLNWNLEKHKFMLGASMDAANAEYDNTTQLGFLTADREAYLDPTQAHPQFIGAYQAINNNNFSGTNTTKSIYFSETWTPVDSLHFSVSGRYNQTQTKNKIAARYGASNYDIADLISYPDSINVCNGDCSTNPPAVNINPNRSFNTVNKAETEKFSFYSFNPSVGATWQAFENLNVFANWAQGTRTPSVIELGCAIDKTPIQTSIKDTDGDLIPDTPVYTAKSIYENRQCSLPTTLSGDPFLPQIRATTYDIGMRGTLGEFAQWNIGAYQTDLKDDIYFVSFGNGRGFFDSIGNTRRRGIEAGLSGKVGKWRMGINYALTDATFEDNFRMISVDNSSSIDKGDGLGYAIDVKPGSRIPGVSLHNLNANVNYEVTDKWTVGLSTVLHSDSYVRGNENNEHKVGVIQDRGLGAIGNALRRPTNNPGTVPGYAVFNFQTSYKFSKEWSATLLINNLFDKEYFSAGRLGRNPFSPSIQGAIGPDGYNHNSNDWLSTNFIAPGAPRGIWFSLNWHFVPD